jgi:integrase
MNWAVSMRILVVNPLKSIPRPSDLPRRRRLHRDEELAIFTLAAREDLAPTRLGEDVRFVALLREFGCRPGELAGLRRDDIDLDSRALRFRDTKNGTDRTIPIVDPVVNLLSLQLVAAEFNAPDSPFLFTTFRRTSGAPVPFYYRSAVDRLRKEGIVDEDFFAAACRREHASAAFEHGLHHEDIRKVTGHKSIKALEIYNVSDALHPDSRKRLNREAQRRAMERFEDMAAALRVSIVDLKAFVSERAEKQRAGDPSGAPAGFVHSDPAATPAGKADGGEGAVRSAMRRATTPVLIPPSGPKAPPASRRSR